MNAIKNNSVKFNLFTIACIYYLADLLLPMIQYYSSVYVNVFFVLVIVFKIFGDSNAVKKQLPPFLLIIFLTLINNLLIIESFKDFILAFYKSTLIFLPIFLGIYLISNNCYKLIKLLIVTTLILLTVTSITSIYGLVEFPLASRQLATGMKNDAKALIYAKMNIGGFSLVYMIPVILPMIFSMYLAKNLKLILFIFFTLPLVYFVYKSQYTTGIISLVIVIMALFIAYKYSHWKLILTAISIFLIFLSFKPLLTNAIKKTTKAQTHEVSERLNALGDLAEGKSNHSITLVGRQNAYMRSINTFISSPIFGGAIFNTGRVGGHSFILDMLASFGLTGIIALYIFYVHILQNLYTKYKLQPYYSYMILSFIISLFLSGLNTSPNIFAIGFFVPIVAYSIKYKKEYGIS